jgi:hypothetical protein
VSEGFAEKLARLRGGPPASAPAAAPPVVAPAPEPVATPVQPGPQSSAVVIPLHPEKQPYAAYGEFKPEQGKRNVAGGRFRIPFKNKKGLLASYGTLKYVYFTDDKLISLVFFDLTINIEGRNLGGLIEALQGEMVEWLQFYDESRFLPPGDGEPVIFIIEQEKPE